MGLPIAVASAGWRFSVGACSLRVLLCALFFPAALLRCRGVGAQALLATDAAGGDGDAGGRVP